MESGNIGDWELDVTSLSDAELAQKLRELGANIGPITNSTRQVYQRKLQRWLKHGPNSSLSHDSLDDSHLEASHMQFDDTSFSDQANGFTDQDVASASPNRKPRMRGSPVRKPVDSHQYQPSVSQEDIDLVDRAMSSDLQSTSYKSTSYQSSSYNATRVVLDDEPELRSRYSGQHVTPRPSLHDYKQDTGRRTASDSSGNYQPAAMPMQGQRPKNKVEGGSRCGRPLVAIIILIAILIAFAVIYNMEPAYAVPQMQ